MDIQLGQIVLSKAGRDEGRYFVVLDIIDESYVLIADGSLRRTEKPKRKKIKHLSPTDQIMAGVEKNTDNRRKINNSEIRKVLKMLVEKDETNEPEQPVSG